jgi:DNA-binding transcriptional LysR family regulator
MELHQLRYLRAVVRTGSVTAAAEAEHVAQPSVSKQIRLLERELGAPLFHRVGRRVVPTEAGMALAECAGRVLDDIEATTLSIAGPVSPAAGHLRICATETVTDHLLPPALAELSSRYPGAHVSVEMLGTDDAVARVLDDSVDLAIVVLPLADSRLDIHPLLREEVRLALPPGHRWAGRESVALAEALVEPGLLLSMPGHGLRAQIEEAAQELGVHVEAVIELRSQQALLAMVAAGGGVAFAPAMSVEGRTDVAAVRLEPGLTREVGWVRRRGRHLPPLASVLLDMLGQGSIGEAGKPARA